MSSHLPVTVYSGAGCPYCVRAKQLLERKGVVYTEIDVRADTAQFEVMLARSGGRKTIPQIFIGDTHVGGFDDLDALERNGKLDEMIAGIV